MWYIEALRKIIAIETKVNFGWRGKYWPVVRISIERQLFASCLPRQGGAPRYFAKFSLANIKRLTATDLLLIKGKAFEGGGISQYSAVFIPPRLSQRGQGSANPYYGWLEDSELLSGIPVFQTNNPSSSIKQIFGTAFDIPRFFVGSILIITWPAFWTSWLAVASLHDKPIRDCIKIIIRFGLFWVLLAKYKTRLSGMKLKTALIVAPKDLTQMALTYTLNKRGTNVLELQHGLVYEGDFGFAKWGQSLNTSLCLPKGLLAWCHADAKYFAEAFSVPLENTAVCGPITMYPFLKNSGYCGNETLEIDTSLEDGKARLLLVLSVAHYQSADSIVKFTLAAAKHHDSIDIRVHPDGYESQFVGYVEEEVRRQSAKAVRVVFSTEINVYDHIRQAAMVIGETPTMVLEAGLLGVPGIFFGDLTVDLMTYSPLPGKLLVSSDEAEIQEFAQNHSPEFQKDLELQVDDVERLVSKFID